MTKPTPECFGTQASTLLEGQPADKCVECEWFDKCHKITVAASLLTISDALDLIVQNGLADGRLKGFGELGSDADAKPAKQP